MSLKALVQLFAEKFLVSKKEWVADQSAYIPSSSTEITVTPDGESHTFTMPYTGLVVLRCYGVTFAELNGFNMVNFGAGANGNICVSLYSKKGSIVSYNIGKSKIFQAANLHVYKTYGSQ